VSLQYRGRHFLNSLDFAPAELRTLVEVALRMKRGAERGHLPGRILALLFFNASVRTRVSCETAMARLGGNAIALTPGRDTWNFEDRDGVVMDQNAQEHVRELSPVVTSMVDAVGIRKCDLITVGDAKTAVTESYAELKKDSFIHAFARFSKKPVLNLESNAAHPLQHLADMATLVEKLGEPRGKKYVLSWAWHPKSLPVATPHSQMLAAADLGMDGTILHPPGYDLDPEYVGAATQRARQLGGNVTVTHDVDGAYKDAKAVCVKSWGSLQYYGRFDEETAAKKSLRSSWICDESKMARTADGIFMHCLPARRNVVVTDGVLDSKRSVVVDQAENRLWTVMALLKELIGG